MLLIRHGESEGNALGVFQGHAEYPLSAHGRAEARAVAERLVRDGQGVASLWSSPLERAFGTAETISDALGLDIQIDDRLKEIDIGEASGMTGAQVRERFPQWGEPGGLIPGQEPNGDFTVRVHSVTQDLLGHDGTVIAVSHGGFISNLCRRIVGAHADRVRLFRVSNCSITEVINDRRGGMVLNRFNQANHLLAS